MTALLKADEIPYRVTDYRRRNRINRLRGWRGESGKLLQRLGFPVVIGELEITVLRRDGSVEHLGVVSRRMVTNAGVDFIKNCFLNTEEAETMNTHASGTGVTAEAATQTALVTEVATRVAGTQVSAGTGAYRTTATIPYTATLAITEHGVFDAASAGDMLDRSLFTAVNVVSGDSIQFQYTITFSSGG